MSTDPMDAADAAELLRQAADLLYPLNDARFTTWPEPVELGRLRHRLRSLADSIDRGAA